MKNETEQWFRYGESYGLYRQVNGGWYEMNGDMAVTAIAHNLGPGESQELTRSWGQLEWAGLLPPGHLRHRHQRGAVGGALGAGRRLPPRGDGLYHVCHPIIDMARRPPELPAAALCFHRDPEIKRDGGLTPAKLAPKTIPKSLSPNSY